MASADVHLTDEPKEEVDISSVSSALEALAIQSGTEEKETDTDDAVAGKQDSSIKEFEKTGNQNSNLTDPANTEKELLKEELKLLQCPFTWNLNFKNLSTTTEKVIADCNDKLKLLEEEEKEDDVEEEYRWWRIFTLTLVLCHEHHISKNSSEALKKLQECENLINKCQSHEKPDLFFQNIKEALLHVVNASKCHLLVSLNMFKEAMELQKAISRYEDMNKQNMAAIFGIRSAMLMEYGYDGTKAALKYAEKAVGLNGNDPEWNFLYGKLLGRIRRAENYAGIPAEKELSALQKAVDCRKNAARIVFLAQAYRDAAHRTFANNRHSWFLKDTINRMSQKSLELYGEALKLNKDSARINIRCAAGLSRLPPPFRNLMKAQDCIAKALMMAPNNAMAHHTAGYIQEKLSNFSAAENFYKKAGELGAYGACMDRLKLKFRMERNYDPMPELERMLQQFTEDHQIQDIYVQMGSYHFYLKHDILTALDYWMKGIEKYPMVEKLKTHKCIFRDMHTTVNLYKFIPEQIQLALKKTDLTDKNIIKLRQMLLYCREKYPEV